MIWNFLKLKFWHYFSCRAISKHSVSRYSTGKTFTSARSSAAAGSTSFRGSTGCIHRFPYAGQGSPWSTTGTSQTDEQTKNVLTNGSKFYSISQDILVEAGPQDGTLLVTWQPVSRPPSSGPVTGYAVYADGKKVHITFNLKIKRTRLKKPLSKSSAGSIAIFLTGAH